MCRLLRFELYGYVSLEIIFPTGWIFIVTIVTLKARTMNFLEVLVRRRCDGKPIGFVYS